MIEATTVLQYRRRDDSAMRYPDGLPAALETDQIIIDSAADAVVVLAGLEWDALAEDQKQQARAWATLAATCMHLDGLQFVAYAMHLQHGHQPTDQPPIVRRSYVEKLMAALRGAADRLIGVSNPSTSRDLARLIRDDAKGSGWRATT
jgi:hypothetical protein